MLDGRDPRDFFGQVRTNAHSYSDPISVNRSMLIRARAKSGTNWSDLAAAAFTADQDFSKLLFTELLYHPTSGNQNEEEFVELKNVGAVPLDLSGLVLVEATRGIVHYNFPQKSILRAGEFVVLVNHGETFQKFYPGVPFGGEYGEDLSNAAGTLAVTTSNGAVAASMRYETHAPWPVVPDDHGYFTNSADWIGFSLVRATFDPLADPHHYRTWRASARRKGSPGAPDPEPNIAPIIVNELLTRSASGLRDTVELYNPTLTNVHLGGWWLSDERNWPYRYSISNGTVITANGYLLLDESHFNVGTNGFAFSAELDRCYIF